MNTTKVGDEFEAKSYELILNAVARGDFGINKEFIRPFKKKEYYSETREKNIKFDLAIELWPQKAERPTITYIIECKNYTNKKVPVDDIEEFFIKYSGLKEMPIKGVMISNNSFQSGAKKFATNKGIMLIEVDNDDNTSIILHKEERKKSSFYDEKISQLITSALGINRIEGLAKLSSKEIENRVYNVLCNINFRPIGQNIPLLIEHLKVEYGLEFEFENNLETVNGKSLLGYCDVKNKKIFIDKSIFGTIKMPFILGHELGHFFLHQNLKLNQEVYNNFADTDFNLQLGKYEFNNPKHWIEWQANKFSTLLFLPEREFRLHLMGFRKSIGISRYDIIYLDNQPVNQKDYIDTVKYLSEYFGISKASIIYRIEDLNLIFYAGGKLDVTNNHF